MCKLGELQHCMYYIVVYQQVLLLALPLPVTTSAPATTKTTTTATRTKTRTTLGSHAYFKIVWGCRLKSAG